MKNRNLGLDLLRFVAVFLVLGRHLMLPEDSVGMIDLWHRVGWIGVDLFFVLSGFLVSSLLFKEYARSGAIRPKRFLARRSLKLYPVFWIMIGVTLVVKIVLGHPVVATEVLGELLFLQNYMGGLWGHTWSLAVEEHFYIFLAILLCWMAKRRGSFDHIPHWFAGVALVCLVFRISNYWVNPEFSYTTWMFHSHLRIDGLFFGVLLAYCWHFRNLKAKLENVSGKLMSTAGVILLLPAFLFPLESNRWMAVWGVMFIAAGAGCLVLAAVRINTSQSATLRFFGNLGAASYPVYLWHYPVNIYGYFLVKKLTGIESFGFYLVFYVVGSFAVGMVFAKLIELPLLNLRDKRFPSLAGKRSLLRRSRTAHV